MVASVPAPTVRTATRQPTADVPVFRPGQTVQAVVAGQAANGLTLLKIGDVIVAAKLPQPMAVGTTLQLEVKSGGSMPQLTIVSELPPQSPIGRPVSLPQPAMPPGGPAIAQMPTPAPQVIATATAAVPQVVIAESEQGVAVAASSNESPTIGRAARPAAEVSSLPLPNAPPASSTAVSRQPGQAVTQSVGGLAQVIEATPAIAVATGPAVAARAGVASGAQAPTEPASLTGAGPRVSTGPLPETPGSVRTSAPTVLPQASAALNAPAGEAIEASPLLVAQEAARPAVLAMTDLPKVIVAVAAAPTGAPPLPETPAAALLQMMPEAMAKQDSIGPLLLSLAALVGKPTGLPEPVLRAAMQVLGARVAVPGETVSAEALAKAVGQSGVFLEAGLSKAATPTADLKAALLALRGVLGKFIGDAVPAGPATTVERAPPPVRGLTPRAGPVEAPPLPDAPRDIARLVHGQADAAVSRVKLMQLASLPDQQAPQAAKTELRMELPFLIGHELVMAQIQIARDGGRRESERKRGWSMRFAMNFAATGEVGADVGLLGQTVSVALWAGDVEIAEQLGAALPELGAALEAVGLKPGALHVRRGAPDAGSVPAGRLLDSVS